MTYFYPDGLSVLISSLPISTLTWKKKHLMNIGVLKLIALLLLTVKAIEKNFESIYSMVSQFIQISETHRNLK